MVAIAFLDYSEFKSLAFIKFERFRLCSH